MMLATISVLGIGVLLAVLGVILLLAVDRTAGLVALLVGVALIAWHALEVNGAL